MLHWGPNGNLVALVVWFVLRDASHLDARDHSSDFHGLPTESERDQPLDVFETSRIISSLTSAIGKGSIVLQSIVKLAQGISFVIQYMEWNARD